MIAPYESTANKIRRQTAVRNKKYRQSQKEKAAGREAFLKGK